VRKFINNPRDVAAETIEGYLAVYGDGLKRIPGTLAIAKAEVDDKVAIVSGGGSGHEPVWLEYIGQGFADAICQGEIFAAPAPQSIVAAARAVHRGKGILFIYGNYAGDKLNFDMATEMLEEEGIVARSVPIVDDVAAAPFEQRSRRRGIAGGFFASKIAGAASEAGLNLDALHALASRAVLHTRSMGVASAGGTVPGSTEPTFTLPDGKLEIGIGMHGEQGVRRADIMAADAVVEEMLQRILDDFADARPNEVCILVNGLGATTRAELLIVARKCRQVLDRLGIAIHDFIVGEMATCQEMHGFSISLFSLDDELRRFYSAPSRCSFFSN
jgi:dihydroxyacetone kinase-like protein